MRYERLLPLKLLRFDYLETLVSQAKLHSVVIEGRDCDTTSELVRMRTPRTKRRTLPPGLREQPWLARDIDARRTSKNDRSVAGIQSLTDQT